MFNEALISKMKRGAYLVNTARGKICDRDAIAQTPNNSATAFNLYNDASGQISGSADAYNGAAAGPATAIQEIITNYGTMSGAIAFGYGANDTLLNAHSSAGTLKSGRANRRVFIG